MVRGALKGCYARKPDEAWIVVNEDTFAGLQPSDCGFSSWQELAAACEDAQWQCYQKALQWTAFPEIVNGCIRQTDSVDAAVLNAQIASACDGLGFDKGKGGSYSCRKYVTDRMALAEEYTVGAKCLAHKDKVF